MCTLILLRRPAHDWPVLIAANRDEMRDRPWRAPGRHWPARPEVRAGLDELAGGSWLGLNDHGLVAAVLNRVGSLGPAPGKRSRGELVLEALDHTDAGAAAGALGALDGRAYRSFNLVVADSRDAWWLRHDGGPRVERRALPEGLTMLTAQGADSADSARVRFHRPRFAAAEPPDPAGGRWASWEALLASPEAEAGSLPFGAMRIEAGNGFGSVNASLIALPHARLAGRRPLWRFAAGAPCSAPFAEVPV